MFLRAPWSAATARVRKRMLGFYGGGGGEGPKEGPSPLGMSPPKVPKPKSTALTPLPRTWQNFPGRGV